MKKLMLVAAIAAVSGAYASSVCDPTPGPSIVAAQRVYDFKASVKMVDGKAGSTTTKTKDPCTGISKVTSYDYYRVKSSRTFKGIIVDCDVCQVEAAGTGDNLALSQAAFYVASSAQKYQWIYEAATYGNTAPGYQVGLLNFIGGVTAAKSKIAEMSALFQFVEYDKMGEEKGFSLMAAGFGTQANGLLKTVSGNLAGESTAAYYCGYWTQCFEPCTLEAYYYWDLDVDPIAQVANTWQLARSPAYDAVYGTWSLKYNASKSKLTYLETLLQKTFGKNYGWMLGGAISTFPFDVTFN